ncbi:MAG TPA: LuxR C-terminal-related transcriptional regulator [Solirubrobacteraceae bacterium]|jgi:LuxR family maltose regulon positive regulatory protein|nr:LuxR C-terminal-related transcriptional regulator [Solirubrobacteraceae bacterium]
MPAHGDQRPIPTVATKLRIPPTPRHLVLRKRLLDALDSGIGERLVLLSAPAGAGKTVLLASWIQTRRLPGPACWLALDGDHNDASRLLEDLLGALRRSGLIERGSPLGRLTPPLGARTERFLALLLNGLAELPSPVVLVLDDVHELTSPQATAAIDFLVRHAPPQCRLVLAGRADPPLPIERLRVCEELAELRIADLAFDRAETAELCHRLDLALAPADIDALWTRTEGWAAALRLAALSLHDHPEPARFVAELTGTDHAVADYLISEVLAHLPSERRELMLRTSIVAGVTPELADALTGLQGGAVALAALEHSGAPVLLADVDGERCYRYHPLFRELLRAHLRHTHSDEVPLLHRRAARWYAQRGETMPAIHHALLGEEWEHAGQLIAENWLALFLDGATAAMRGPMSQLPPDIIAADPRLAAACAGSRLQDGDLLGAEHHLTSARHARAQVGGSGSRAREQLDATLTAVALHHARLRVRLDDAERLARRLTGLARAREHHGWNALRSFALANLGATRLWAGDPHAGDPSQEAPAAGDPHAGDPSQEASAAGDPHAAPSREALTAAVPLQEALALATEDGHQQIALDCLAQLAIVHLRRGELHRAAELSARAVALAEQRGWEDGPAAACAHLAAGAVAYHQGELERAEGLLAQAAAAADTAEAPLRHAAALLEALVLAGAGPRSAARGALKLHAIRAAAAAGEPVPHFLATALDAAEPRVLAAAGEVEQAHAALACGLAQSPDCPELHVLDAAFALHDGELARAADVLAPVLDEPRGAGLLTPAIHPATLIEAWLTRALVERAVGDERAAALALDNALDRAEREPYRDAFLLGGAPVRELLELQARTGTAHPALLEVLLDGAGGGAAGVGGIDSGAGPAEPLTEREQRILRYLPTMLSNAEIGAEMFVSLNTVKTHLRSIYRKLEASGRADAVERARRLGLLPSGIKRPRVVQRV